MQAASDILLGWLHTTGPDGVESDYYVRQLWDWKASVEVEALGAQALTVYAQMCAWTLARAHARSGDEIAIAAYLGSGNAFDRAVARFSQKYADQNERDYHALLDAIAAERLPAQTGV
jgi:predicted alpha/beta hydrolase